MKVLVSRKKPGSKLLGGEQDEFEKQRGPDLNAKSNTALEKTPDPVELYKQQNLQDFGDERCIFSQPFVTQGYKKKDKPSFRRFGDKCLILVKGVVLEDDKSE